MLTIPLSAGQRCAGLDVLRLGLALAVVLFHWHHLVGPDAGTGKGLTFLGRFGVEAFFLLSGAVIALSLERHAPAAFLRARARRLWPGLAACAALTLLILGWLGRLEPQDGGRWIAAALLLPLAGPDRGYLDNAYWSIAYEIRFYLFAAALAALGLRDRLAEGLLVLAVPGLALAASGRPDVAALILYPYAPLFAVGVLMASTPSPRRTALWLAALAMAGPGIRDRVMMDGIAPGFSAGQGYAVLAAAVVLVWGFARLPVPRRLVPLAVLAGGISYPLYLLHQRAGIAVLGRLEGLGVPPPMAAGIALAGFLAAAWAVHLAVERGATRPRTLSLGAVRAGQNP